MWAHGAQVDACENNDFLDLGPGGFEATGELVSELLQSPFVIVNFFASLARTMRILIDRTIGQMRKLISQLRIVITVSTETNQTLFEEIELHWSHLWYGYIYAHVPLAAFD